MKQLKEEITRERQLLAEETVDRDQIISQLKDTIQEVKQLTTSELKYLKKETRAHEMTVKQVCQRKADKLDGEHGMVQRELAIEQKAHQTIMDFLALQRQELEVQIQEWMNKYETDTEAKAQELEALKQQRAADFERYEELVSQYEDLEKKVEEDRVAKEQAVTERKVTAQRVRAARKIQNWWRKLREAMKAAKKKKGKGSAKKKKK